MEWKTYRACVDPAIEKLEWLHDELSHDRLSRKSIHALKLDLGFFKMLFWGMEYCEEAEKDLHLASVMRAMGDELKRTAQQFIENLGRTIKSWWRPTYSFADEVGTIKPYARKSCTIFLGGGFRCSWSSKSYGDVWRSVYANEMDCFIAFILDNVQLLSLKLDGVAPLKQQIGFIQGKLKLFRSFVQLVSEWMTEDGRVDKLLLHTYTWVIHISCLSCLYWIDGIDESQAGTKAAVLSDLMQKTMPYTAEVITLYFGVLTATRFHDFEIKIIHQLTELVPRYVDFLLENVGDTEIFREGLNFLLSFVMHPPTEDFEDGKLIWEQIDALISEVPSIISAIHFDETTQNESMSKIVVADFLQRIERLKVEVRKLYVHFPFSSEYNCSRTNAIKSLDFLLGNLENMLEMEVNFIAHTKHHAQAISEELALLRPCLQNIMKLQNDHVEINVLWARIINVVYNADYAIKLSSTRNPCVWYCIVCLSTIIDDIKLIKIEVKEIEDHNVYKNNNLSDEMESSDARLSQTTTSKFDGAFEGFQEDARSIIDQLKGGRKDLTIISISGMPGQGKTTLAQRIYGDPSIQSHFYKILWCYVSKKCKIKELLLDLCGGINKENVEKDPKKLETQDVAERLRKSLKGKRYFIVMDDIWEVAVWREVEGSFPNDRNGSRILFTSRNHNLASEANQNSISHPLRLFSNEESWELMKERLFSGSRDAPEFLEIGKQIANYCKGLPLSVVLMAAILGRTEKKLALWNQVAENLKSHLASEGCMHIIELSYKYLPDHLKPCFLYFGAFPRGKSIRARKLTLLWIAEGFVSENDMQCTEDLANQYLDNLVSQSLVVITERSSIGGIKACNVHDLLYDLCMDKAKEEDFLNLTDETTFVDQCYFGSRKYNHHRLCIGESDPFTKPRPICTREKLHSSPIHSILWSYNYSWRDEGPFFKSPASFVENFQVLSILDLEDALLPWRVIPDIIMSIIHLKYLSIWAFSVVSIPGSITNLWNLQTLILRKQVLTIELPAAMLKMKKLRHVNIDNFRFCFEDFEENGCDLYVEELETLRAPILSYDHKTVEFLNMLRLPRLRKLRCNFGEGFSDMWFSVFRSLSKLESLRIDYVGHCLPDYSVNFPGFNFPENLKKLTLSGFNLPWSVVSTIGKMPNLEVLKLLDGACLGTKWDLEDDGDFSKLRYLKLQGLDIEQINASSESFPCLEELVVKYCRQLEEISSSFGEIYTLKTIKVLGPHQASDSLRKILRQQREIGNHSFQILFK